MPPRAPSASCRSRCGPRWHFPPRATDSPRGEAQLTRRQLEDATAPLVERVAEPCRRCLAEARLAEPVDDVLLLGGQSRAPQVIDVVAHVFGRPPSRAVSMDERVAMGAAILAGVVQGEVDDLLLARRDAAHAGHRDARRDLHASHRAQQPDPDAQDAASSRRSTTTRRGCSCTCCRARATSPPTTGASRSSSSSRSRGRRGASRRSRSPSAIDVNGAMSVEATDQATGRRQAIQVHPSGGLSPAEVDRLAEGSAPERHRAPGPPIRAHGPNGLKQRKTQEGSADSRRMDQSA